MTHTLYGKNNDMSAMIAVLDRAGEDTSVKRAAELTETGALSVTEVTRSGRRVCWLRQGIISTAVYCDTLEPLTAAEIHNDIL